jgi:hypothetical protein
VVEGSVRKDRERVRIHGATHRRRDRQPPLWAERYDRDLAGIFSMQDEITEAIVATIEPQLYAAENFRAQRKAPENLDAWGLVMRALRHFWRMSREDNLAAQKLLEQAIAIEPDYAQALAVLGVSHMFGVQMGWEAPATITPIAERTALAAVRADGSLRARRPAKFFRRDLPKGAWQRSSKARPCWCHSAPERSRVST